MEATFFVFPTLSEAAAIVLCEACAHGLPSLVPDTGGMRYVIRDGENGFVMPEHAEGVQYADKIMQVFADQNFYRHLLETSRLSYEERLNWDAWGKAVQPLFERVCRRAAA
jgi:glycosyltransferase involved in cell wall biosynthesis